MDADVEILSFVTAHGSYYFLAADGRRGDIIKCRNLQPPIQDHENYETYLWVKAVQGYYLLRQFFIDGQAQEWRICKEITIDDPNLESFDEVGDHLAGDLQGQCH